MKLTIDERECPTEALTVAEAIADAAGIAEGQGRLIVDVIVDGMAWTEEQIARAQEEQTTADEVCLVSADPRELARETFLQAAEALSDAATLQQEAAELIQADERSRALERLGECIAIWTAVHEATVKGADVAAIEIGSVEVGAIRMTDAIAALCGQLETIRDALRSGDPVALSDNLLYELPGVMDQWIALLDELARRTGQEAG